MTATQILTGVQIIISISLIITVLMQQQSSGLGAMFGGVGGESYTTRRGGEKLFFNLTIVLGVFFAVNSLALFVLNSRA